MSTALATIPDAKLIKLSLRGNRGSGKTAIVDNDAAGQLAATHKWYLSAKGYVMLSRPVDGETYLHRFIAKPLAGFHVDHANGNKLDNRRENLRVCTQEENNRNIATKRSHSRQPYKGVRATATRMWNARIRFKGKEIHIGNYTSAMDAAIAYDAKAKLLFGNFAALNFGEQDVK